MSLNPSVATSVVPSESVSNARIDYTARELSISKRRQRLKNPTDIWYHFEKGRKTNAVICDYCDLELPVQKQSGTNTYWRHLQQKHRNIHDEAKPIKLNILDSPLWQEIIWQFQQPLHPQKDYFLLEKILSQITEIV